MTNKTEFEATIREQKSYMPGKYGKVTSKSLARFIGKKVKITVEEA